MAADFAEWLLSELASRGWSNSELARRSGVTPSAMSRLINRQTQPSWETCLGIAKALGYPPEQVLRKSGLLPELTGQDDQAIQEVREVMRGLTDTGRRQVLSFALFVLQQEQRDEESQEG